MSNEWEQEQARIDEVIEIIGKNIAKITHDNSGVKKDIVEIRKTFWDDVTVNFDEPDDLGETFTSIKQQAEMLSERERTHYKMDQRLKSLHKLKYAPYFGRFDFHEEGEVSKDIIYIGTASLMDENEENFLIYDWRAPISSVYYDYATGPARFETMDGTIHGEILLKRQFIIKGGTLKGMFDTGVTIGDEVLQQVLSNNANNQMKSIVATIQKEQNQIIRNEHSKLLFVQGVAGSGKTSAALQRIAYLLYRYRGMIQSDNIMLFSPNPMFSHYVATVLPELGEDNMEQMTFQAYLEGRLSDKYELEDAFSQMEYVLTANRDEEYEARIEGIGYKGSYQFLELIHSYVRYLSQEGLIFKNIRFRGDTLISAEEIKNFFYALDGAISIPNRIGLTMDWLLKEVSKYARKERKKDWVTEEIQFLDHDDYQKIFKRLQKQQQFTENTFNDFEQEERELAKFIVSRRLKSIRQTIKGLGFIDLQAVYCQLFELSKVTGLFGENKLPAHWSEICRQTIINTKKKALFFEDAIVFLYLQDQIEGRKPNTSIRHLFIDEAQDYTPFQFAFLKQLFPMCQMTILGDLNQAIFSETMNAPSIFSEEIESIEKIETITLTKSYRSTKEIVEFTKKLIKGGNLIEPINRSGKKPQLKQVANFEMLYSEIAECIHQLKENGMQTIAVICKTEQESKEVYTKLSEKIKVKRIDKETYSFEKGVVIIPVYLAKGIEFDAVIIPDCSKAQYAKESEQKLLYTACTRAMHELYLFYVGEKSNLFHDICNELYTATK
ncbi:MAG TPA: UvrD-helicase domain-containing protein [Bacillus bacterium]|nr:UvrD-helicase domain-containing protein [Bacillus sp. (in: firmicutes)]